MLYQRKANKKTLQLEMLCTHLATNSREKKKKKEVLVKHHNLKPITLNNTTSPVHYP